MRVSLAEAQRVAEAALLAHGASAATARSVARSIVAAEAEGNRAVGFAHLVDYLEALDAGRIDGAAAPVIARPTANVIQVDACANLPHEGVDAVWEDLVRKTVESGIAILSLRNGYTCGALGYFARRLAEGHGLAALVAANAGPAVMPAAGGTRPVFSTNPLAFAAPWPDGGALVIDQSSSASAIVGIRQAVAEGRRIPEGWALDSNGAPTTDPEKALAGTLLPFGGWRGANIALMVELLAAGLTGGNWSARAPAFNKGAASPGVGLFIMAVNPIATNGPGFISHLRDLMEVLTAEEGVHIPGIEKKRRAAEANALGISVQKSCWDRVFKLCVAPSQHDPRRHCQRKLA